MIYQWVIFLQTHAAVLLQTQIFYDYVIIKNDKV